MSERNHYFDLLKGVAIILVVLGHSIQILDVDYYGNPVFRLIYMFHMPLFIFISGYFLYPSVQKLSLSNYLVKQIKHLGYPIFFWGLFSCVLMLLSKLMQHKYIDILYFIDLFSYSVWFLPVLLLFTIIGAIINVKFKYNYIGWSISCIIVFLIPDYTLVPEIKYLLPFFIVGIFLKDLNWKKWNILIVIVSVLIFSYLFTIYNKEYFIYNTSFLPFDISILKIVIIRYIAGITGIIIITWLCFFITSKKIILILAKLGTLTLPIYVVHQNFFLINRIIKFQTDSFLIMSFISLMIILLSIVFYKMCSFLKLKRLLFGEENIKRL